MCVMFMSEYKRVKRNNLKQFEVYYCLYIFRSSPLTLLGFWSFNETLIKSLRKDDIVAVFNKPSLKR